LSAKVAKETSHLLPAGRVLLEDLLDNLLLLDEESADDTVLDAVGAAGTTVGALDGLLGAGDGGVLARTKGRDLLIENERSCQWILIDSCGLVVQKMAHGFDELESKPLIEQDKNLHLRA